MNAQSPVGLMFGRIAGVYDLLNHVLSLGVDHYWRRRLAGQVRAGSTGQVADLAAGTLDVSLAILKKHPQARIAAIDFCPQMLQHGIQKLRDPGQKCHIFAVVGDALAIPAPDDAFDSLTMAFGIRNIQDRSRAFAEMLRILAPGGRACILEFGSGKEKIWGGLYNLYLNHLLPLIGSLIARDRSAYGYLARTIREFPEAEQLAAEMRQAGFDNVSYTRLTSGIVCLHVGEKPS